MATKSLLNYPYWTRARATLNIYKFLHAGFFCFAVSVMFIFNFRISLICNLPEVGWTSNLNLKRDIVLTLKYCNVSSIVSVNVKRKRVIKKWLTNNTWGESMWRARPFCNRNKPAGKYCVQAYILEPYLKTIILLERAEHG